MSRIRFMAMLGALGLTGALSVAATAAADVAPNGQIAYELENDIWVMDADGANPVNLTNTPDAQELDPVWSPDGGRIAFISNRITETDPDGNFEIYAMAPDGTSVTQITSATPPNPWDFYQSSEPTWSPDGSQIAFTGYRQYGAPQIFIVPADGSAVETLLTDPQDFASKGQPDWSPDGTKIMFTWNLGQQDVYVIAPDGTGQTNLTPDTMGWNERSGVWSPDGARFAFVDDRFFNHLTFNTDIFLRNADGTGEFQLTFDEHIDDDPAWAPDGTQIAFSSTRGGSYDIYLIDVPPLPGEGVQLVDRAEAGSEPPVTRLTNTAEWEQDPDWGTEAVVTHRLDVQRAGAGAGTVRSKPAGISCGTDCSESYATGTRVRLQAIAKSGSTFAGWSGPCRRVSPTVCAVTMKQARVVTAIFELA
jgi:dipeptidyl aminopeptidase/acylaminoacyl peptidase